MVVRERETGPGPERAEQPHRPRLGGEQNGHERHAANVESRSVLHARTL
jgi:hypothetical protein